MAGVHSNLSPMRYVVGHFLRVFTYILLSNLSRKFRTLLQDLFSWHPVITTEKLHWLPISERIKYKVACMCFSAINGSGPAYLSELLHVYTPSRTLRSSSDTRMLEIQQYKRKTHGFRTFSCFGPHIWNSLPQDLRHCATLSSFKAKLKTFLFSQYFHPTTSNFTSSPLTVI